MIKFDENSDKTELKRVCQRNLAALIEKYLKDGNVTEGNVKEANMSGAPENWPVKE